MSESTTWTGRIYEAGSLRELTMAEAVEMVRCIVGEPPDLHCWAWLDDDYDLLISSHGHTADSTVWPPAAVRLSGSWADAVPHVDDAYVRRIAALCEQRDGQDMQHDAGEDRALP